MANWRSLGGKHVIVQANEEQDAGSLCDVGGDTVEEGQTRFFSCAP